MIDVTEQINAVRRQVGGRVLEAGEARTVVVGQTYGTGLDDLWDACTNPERIPRWFLPVSGELKLGGKYQIEGNAGGTITRCDAPHGFDATWEYGGDVSWIEVRLTAESDDRTGSSSRTSRTSTTSGGPSSGRGPSASAGTWGSWAWGPTSPRAGA